MKLCKGPSTASISTSGIFAGPKPYFVSKTPIILLSLSTSTSRPVSKNGGFNHPCASHHTLSHQKGGGGNKPLLPYIISSSFKVYRAPSVIPRFATRKMAIINKDLVI